MEQKLLDFKLRKRRENLLNTGAEILNKFKMFGNKDCESDANSTDFQRPLLEEQRAVASSPVMSDGEISIASSNVSADMTWTPPSWLTLSTYLLYLLLWFTVFLIAVQLEFGYVYCIVSGLVFMYFNTRTGPKKSGEVSAYSVFNTDCKAIDGTLKAEQFEKEFNLIRHNSTSPPVK